MTVVLPRRKKKLSTTNLFFPNVKKSEQKELNKNAINEDLIRIVVKFIPIGTPQGTNETKQIFVELKHDIERLKGRKM